MRGPAAATLDARLDELLAYVRRINAIVVVVAFASYGLAYYVWTLGQSLGALVIATLGYLLFRSMRRISFNLAWQNFAGRDGFEAILKGLDEHWVLRPRADIKAHLHQLSEDSERD